eukprot:1944169-Rhodomonas_salina.1
MVSIGKENACENSRYVSATRHGNKMRRRVSGERRSAGIQLLNGNVPPLLQLTAGIHSNLPLRREEEEEALMTDFSRVRGPAGEF